MMFGTGLNMEITRYPVQEKVSRKLTAGVVLVHPGMVHSLATTFNLLRPFRFLVRQFSVFKSRIGHYIGGKTAACENSGFLDNIASAGRHIAA